MKFTFTGCSFTVGEGLDLEKVDPYNYSGPYSHKQYATMIIKYLEEHK